MTKIRILRRSKGDYLRKFERIAPKLHRRLPERQPARYAQEFGQLLGRGRARLPMLFPRVRVCFANRFSCCWRT